MIELTHNIIRTVRSLNMKKNRIEHGLFVAEGTKCVRDTFNSFKCRWLIATKEWMERYGHQLSTPHDGVWTSTGEEPECYVPATKEQMRRVSNFETAGDVIAVYEIPTYEIQTENINAGLNIAIDNIQDPGNLGTIIRAADWFGLHDIYASTGTVDVYNHKVVQATMGAIGRVRVHYGDLTNLFKQYPYLPVCGTYTQGDNIYDVKLPQKAFVVFGNEGNGISDPVTELVTQRLSIPKAPDSGSESLNVALAAAITISEFIRQSRFHGIG